MRVRVCAVGRLRAGPEHTLVNDYLSRFDRTGRSLGLGPASVLEVEDKKNGGLDAESDLLSKAIPKGALIATLDERGRLLSSIEFAKQLEIWRDGGRRDVAFVIGGADGIAAELRARSDFSLSFGKMVWPHLLARVMLCEQLYRAATILSGGPYHRV